MIIRRLRQLPKHARHKFYLALTWMVLSSALDALCALALVPFIRAWFRQDSHQIYLWLGVLVGLTLIQGIVFYGSLRRGYISGGALATGLIDRLVQYLPWRASITALRDPQISGLLRNHVLQAMAIPAHLLAPLINAVVTPTVVVLGLFFIHRQLGMFLVCAALILFLLLRWSGKQTLAMEAARQEADRAMGQTLQAFAMQQGLLRASGLHNNVAREMQTVINQQYHHLKTLLRRALPVSLGFSAAVQSVFMLLLLGGAYFVVRGYFDLATWVAVLVLTVRFIEPLALLTHLDQALRNAWQSFDKVLTILAQPTLIHPENGLKPINGSIDIKAVGYYLPDRTPLLQGINLQCPTGSTMAIVGPSGAGKSTLLALMARVFDVVEGQITLGEVALDQITARDLAHCRHVVFQDNRLFKGTIAWNIRMANPQATDAMVEAALIRAAFGPDLALMPQGINTAVGPEGAALSGGQRQRVCLARCLISEARILLLDEPTANLDTQSAAHVGQTLAKLKGTTTVVMVTHNPILAAQADHIIVLVAGKIQAQGSHTTLITENTWYQNFGFCRIKKSILILSTTY